MKSLHPTSCSGSQIWGCSLSEVQNRPIFITSIQHSIGDHSQGKLGKKNKRHPNSDGNRKVTSIHKHSLMLRNP